MSNNFVNMEIEGLDELNKALESMKKNFEGANDLLLKRLGEKVKTDVKLITPVDTGLLRNSWHRKTNVANNTVTIYNNQPYANHIEFGHRTRGGNGFVPGRFMLRETIQGIAKDIQNTKKAYFKALLGK